MRVLHVVDTSSFAGVERHIARLARAQARTGYTVRILGGEPERMAREAGPAVVVHPTHGLLPTVRSVSRWAPHADVVHVHMTAAEVAAALARPLARARGQRLPPVVATRHFARLRGSGPAGALTATLARWPVRAQISISAYVARHVDGASVVVPPGADVADEPRPASERGRVVLLAQRLEPEKDSDVAVRAFAASQLAAEGWELHLAGDGSLREALEVLTSELGVADATRFLGRRDDVPTLMDGSALAIAPCAVEGLGLTVLEAMAHGLPVVASDAGGHTELLGDVQGAALFMAGNAAAAGALLRALAEDPGARDAYAHAEQARQRARFTLDAQVAATDAVYRSVL